MVSSYAWYFISGIHYRVTSADDPREYNEEEWSEYLKERQITKEKRIEGGSPPKTGMWFSLHGYIFIYLCDWSVVVGEDQQEVDTEKDAYKRRLLEYDVTEQGTTTS